MVTSVSMTPVRLPVSSSSKTLIEFRSRLLFILICSFSVKDRCREPVLRPLRQSENGKDSADKRGTQYAHHVQEGTVNVAQKRRKRKKYDQRFKHHYYLLSYSEGKKGNSSGDLSLIPTQKRLFKSICQ